MRFEWWVGLAWLGVSWSAGGSTVLINEIMYHPASEDVREEYVELANLGTTDIDLEGWRFSKGIRYSFSNLTLRAGGYLVVAADLEAFANRYPGVTNVVGNWEGILSNRREDLDLDDASGARVDSVEYADEGDWAERRRGPLDRNHRGVVWDADHDGKGRSLELINPRVSNNYGANWAASPTPHGSPGTVNGAQAVNIPPLIVEPRHFPLVPRSSDRVVVTLRLIDERTNGLSARLFWRLDAVDPEAFASVAMFDDGLHEDGSPADGVFAGAIPPQAHDAIVEFYIEASDAEGLVRHWPGPVRELVGTPAQVANALYQVDDERYAGEQPLYKLILRESDYAELYAIGHASNGDQRSDAQFNATFLSLDGTGEECRYAVGIRNRGHGTRNLQPNNWRVNLRSDEPWRGVSALNFNGHYTHLQHLGAALSLASGLAAAQARPAQLRVNNANLGLTSGRMFNTTYVVNEVYNSEFAGHRFPADSSGNLYRALRDLPPSDFTWRGTNASAYTNTWFKTTNASEDDWSDLIELARVLGTNDLYSAAAARQVADVEQWLRYFAVMALLNNRETSPNRGYNDDYLLYAGVLDPRFQLLPYDLDTILGQGDAFGSTTNSLFGAVGQPAFQRILEEPEFRAAYYRTLRRLLATSFAPERFDALADQMLSGYVPGATRDSIKSWMTARRDYVQSQIPADLPPEVTVRATLLGVPRSPTPATSVRIQVGGVGVAEYRYSLDAAPFGPALPVGALIELPALPAGSHQLRVVGGTADGVWQDETASTMVLWVVSPAWPAVRLNEVLARNETAAPHEGTFPDIIELFNEGSAAVDLAGLRLTDDPTEPDKFSFPDGTSLAAGGFLRLHANDRDGTSGIHLGFSLSAEGEGVYLYDRVARGGALLDQVEFGPQLADRAIGRLRGGGEWLLVAVSPGSANEALPLADVAGLRINEWLADGRAVFTDDFIELYNPGDAPVDLGGLSLTDNVTSAVDRHRIAPLTFVGPRSCLAFLADGQTAKGPRHLGFKLAPEQGEIGLFAADGTAIDLVLYGTQRTDVSQGRQPSGADTLAVFAQPSPGALNPVAGPSVVEETVALVSLTNLWVYNATEDLSGAAWTERDYDDTAWPGGQAGFWHDADDVSGPTNTPLSLGRTTYYFRTTFQFEGDPAEVALRFLAFVDDGAVLHLNGTELYRLRMPVSGAIDYDTYASSTVDDAAVEGPFPISNSALRAGENVVAV
ncbi:MAG: lamin tail domain-containing protein, partial [Verrucomicrobia bacterium]|nr:lamin tail domain-containing protein [Verrucomicrobiota bacterium]